MNDPIFQKILLRQFGPRKEVIEKISNYSNTKYIQEIHNSITNTAQATEDIIDESKVYPKPEQNLECKEFEKAFKKLQKKNRTSQT